MNHMEEATTLEMCQGSRDKLQLVMALGVSWISHVTYVKVYVA